MPTYSGETIRIKVTVTNFDGAPITDVDVTSATVEIFDTSGAEVIGAGGADLVWDATRGYWYYDWQTTGTEVGKFTAKATFVGAAFTTFEFAHVVLKAPPVGGP